jgi:hypothetical protein
MLSIRSSADLARAFDGLLELELRNLLALRRDQLIAGGEGDLGDYAHFVVQRFGDTLADVEAEVGFPLTGDAAPIEWVERHPGGWLEAAIITDDDGFALVVIVRECVSTDFDLLAALRAHA